MKSRKWAKIGLYVASLSVAALASAAQFNYVDFSSMSGMNLLGNASQQGNVLRLTDMAGGQSGYAWQGTQQHVASGFDTTFKFRVREEWPGSGADGFAFVIQNNSGTFSAGPEAAGGGMGYHETLANSVVIEFDTYTNWGLEPRTSVEWYFDWELNQWLNFDYADYYTDWDHAWDFYSNNHVAIQTRGTSANSADYNQSGIAYGFPNFKITDGQEHTAHVVYDGTAHTLKMYLDGEAQPTLSGSIDLSTKLSLNNGMAWVGFTAATGGAVSEHDILAWNFKSSYQWSGFLSPVAHKQVFKAGSTIPVKFQLVGASAGITNAAANFTVNGATAGYFRYDVQAGQYIMNWQTTGLPTGNYVIGADLGDGTVRQVTLTLN